MKNNVLDKPITIAEQQAMVENEIGSNSFS